MTLPVSETILKDLYAAALLRTPDDPYGAAIKLFGDNPIKAIEVSQKWPFDFYVLTKQSELLAELGEDEFLPGKAALARRVLDLGDNPQTDKKERLAAYKLYAEIRGFVEKSGGVQINNNITNNRVMVMKDHGTNDDWEAKAKSQQAKLIEHARD